MKGIAFLNRIARDVKIVVVRIGVPAVLWRRWHGIQPTMRHMLVFVVVKLGCHPMPLQLFEYISAAISTMYDLAINYVLYWLDTQSDDPLSTRSLPRTQAC